MLGADGKFTTKLREIGKDGIAKHHQEFLNNIQDARANFECYPRMEDELERKTKRFRADNVRGMEDFDDEDDDDEDEDDEEEPMSEQFMDCLLGITNQMHQQAYNNDVPKNFSFNGITGQRTKKEFRLDSACVASYQSDFASGNTMSNNNTYDFIETVSHNATHEENQTPANVSDDKRPKASKRKIVQLILTKERVHNKVMPGTKKKAKNVLKANGTAESILSWSKAAELDKRQRRAFIILAAQFVLTFYDDDEEDASVQGDLRQKFNKEKRRLKVIMKLKSGQQSIENLVMMLPHHFGLFCDSMHMHDE